MKKLMLSFLFVIEILLCLTSCSTDPISRLRSLCETIEESGSNFNDKDWESVMIEYDNIMKDIAEENFTQEELKEIGRLEARFFVKAGSKLGGTYARSIKSELEGISEELNNTDIEQVIKDEGLEELFK